jgi:hypothetical protein
MSEGCLIFVNRTIICFGMADIVIGNLLTRKSVTRLSEFECRSKVTPGVRH